MWRSDDGGVNWAVVNWQRALIGRAGYYIRLGVNPTNPDEVFVADSSFWGSTDGGKSFRTLSWGGDTHDIWIDPTNPNRILVTHDGGASWTRHVLPLAGVSASLTSPGCLEGNDADIRGRPALCQLGLLDIACVSARICYAVATGLAGYYYGPIPAPSWAGSSGSRPVAAGPRAAA